jgi:A/G-specific adenine glycosylase
MEPEDSIPFFRSALLAWFRRYQRKLPWRKEYHPYHVWISEIMGQQTQMERVVDYFTTWISLFPDIPSVASASEQSIFKAWEGLGYYSRARNIRKTASLLVRQYDSVLPGDYELLLSLPGIGPYTAAAIMSIAFNQPVPVLDANVERVLCRVLDLNLPVKHKVTRQQLHRFSKVLLPKDEPRDFNQALMELGALVCKPKKPECRHCPVRKYCRALAVDTVDLRPVPIKKDKKIDIIMACGIILHENRVYIQQRLEDDVWGGLWEFPGGRLKAGETLEQAAVREVAEETEFIVSGLDYYAAVVHYYTKYRVTLHSFFCTLQENGTTPVLHAASQFKWVNWADIEMFAFPSGHRKLIKKIAAEGLFHKGVFRRR